MAAIDPLTAGGVLLATAATDAVYVMFTSAVVARRRVPAATWSSIWYLLSSYAVISYTENWVYVAFAAPDAAASTASRPAFRDDARSAPLVATRRCESVRERSKIFLQRGLDTISENQK